MEAVATHTAIVPPALKGLCYFKLGLTFARDYGSCLARLEVVRLRLFRFDQVFPTRTHPWLTPDDYKVYNTSRAIIEEAFEETAKRAKKYKSMRAGRKDRDEEPGAIESAPEPQPLPFRPAEVDGSGFRVACAYGEVVHI